MNELSVIFHLMGIDTTEVLEAAGTKWNFLPFRPGLVGGHCIGVDPYYLTYKAEDLGYRPQVILAGRRIIDTMGKYVAQTAVKMMIRQNIQVKGARVGILGLTFKEDVPDLRNSKVVDILAELNSYGVELLVHDPLADPAQARAEYGIELSSLDALTGLDALILAVGHSGYTTLSLAELKGRFAAPQHAVLLDVKSIWNRQEARNLGYDYWRL